MSKLPIKEIGRKRLPLEKLEPMPRNREYGSGMSAKSLKELADSIAEVGIQQDIQGTGRGQGEWAAIARANRDEGGEILTADGRSQRTCAVCHQGVRFVGRAVRSQTSRTGELSLEKTTINFTDG